jgi:hypothetical protein
MDEICHAMVMPHVLGSSRFCAHCLVHNARKPPIRCLTPEEQRIFHKSLFATTKLKSKGFRKTPPRDGAEDGE